ncbi:hypothetical protein, partial [Escherichia coli]|uniref:hypothetical protein n=1 Tax=Escherichia coli TaxID=562 RepID=UPI00200C2DA0
PSPGSYVSPMPVSQVKNRWFFTRRQQSMTCLQAQKPVSGKGPDHGTFQFFPIIPREYPS